MSETDDDYAERRRRIHEETADEDPFEEGEDFLERDGILFHRSGVFFGWLTPGERAADGGLRERSRDLSRFFDT